VSEWFKSGEKLPVEGKTVDIKIPGGSIVRGVLFENGRFWKIRKGKNAGNVWRALGWAYPEKAKLKKSDIIGTGPLPDKIASDDVHADIDSEGYGDG